MLSILSNIKYNTTKAILIQDSASPISSTKAMQRISHNSQKRKMKRINSNLHYKTNHLEIATITIIQNKTYQFK